jgi:hypothetical protein
MLPITMLRCGPCWETAVVSFHETFWLAASAAAPVITLAIVVVIPDAARIRFQAERRKWELHLPANTASATSEEAPPAPGTDPGNAAPDELQPKSPQWAVQVTRRNVRLCYANLIAQAALLGVSLLALAYSRDFVPPWLAIVVAVGGIGLLAWTLLRGAGIRDEVERAIGTAHNGSG